MAKRAAHVQRPPVFGNNPSGKGKSKPNTACPLGRTILYQAGRRCWAWICLCPTDYFRTQGDAGREQLSWPWHLPYHSSPCRAPRVSGPAFDRIRGCSRVTGSVAMATILVVDDEKNYLWMLGELFQNEGHEVLTCEKGSEALTLLRDGQVDLLLTDLRMVEMDGMALLARAREI